MTAPTPTVVVGMSGGVDSSVTALHLKEQGYNVIGLFMKNWEESDENGVCKASYDYEDVVKVSDQIGIPCYSVNFVKQYWDGVFSHFLKEFEMGYTPNPDILCNREIKFKALLDKALELGADFLATGHYCRKDTKDGRPHLLKGLDPLKDQSYFLYTMREEALKKVLFPIGDLPKTAVRDYARKFSLTTSDKKDSTGICFIGKRDFKEFLGNYLKKNPGPFMTPDGKVVGQHDGAIFYTIGQRKGMGLGGPGEAWFVCSKDPAKNIVYVVQGTRHPALYCDELTATEMSWVNEAPSQFPYRCRAKVRYRQPDQSCEIVKCEEGRLFVKFDIPQRAVTPRQSVVFYDNEHCLGGAMIESAGPSYHARGLSLPEIVSP